MNTQNTEYKTIQQIRDNLNNIDFEQIDVQDREETYSEKYINLLTPEQILECLKYVNSDEPEQLERNNFLDIMEKLESVRAKYIGQKTPEFSEQREQPTNTYNIIVKGKNGVKFSMKFYNSLNDTWNNKTVGLYDILTTIGSEGTINTNSFEDFCDELGFDYDSRKAHKAFNELQYLQRNISKIFDKTDLYDFPN